MTPEWSLETDRLRLGPCHLLDPQKYLEILRSNRQHIGYYMPDEILKIDDVGAVNSFFEMLRGGWDAGSQFCVAALDRLDGSFLAQLYVERVDGAAHVFEIGYFVDRDQQGRGIAIEAVSGLSHFLVDRGIAHKLCLICDADNQRSIRVAEKAGFSLEGVLREHALNKDGTRPDRRFYGLLRSDVASVT